MVAVAEDEVLYELTEGVALITFNRPHRMNAYTHSMRNTYLTLLKQAGEDDAVRAVVITGAGRAYCAGADFESLRDPDKDKAFADRAKVDVGQDYPIAMAKPVIAAINGSVAGAGLVDALLTDVRFAAAGAKFTFAFSRYGLTAEGGSSWVLPRLVGTARALDLLWSSRQFFSEDALRYGLVQFVLPGDEVVAQAVAYARDLVDNVSSYSLATMKQQIYEDWDVPRAEAFARMFAKTVESVKRAGFAPPRQQQR